MSDKRRTRRAKQARREARRTNKRTRESPSDTTLTDIVHSALARGHPLHLLSVASLVINVAKPDTLRNETYLDSVLTGLTRVRNREMTALLAVVAELLIDDPAAQQRCRQELAERGEHLPRWISALPRVEVYRAARRTHVLGDVDELVLGARLNGRHELTIAVQIDHIMLSSISDAGVLLDPIDRVLARVAATSSDIDVVEMNLADARAWIEDALTKPTLVPETETWPLYRPLVRWLVGRLPEGGERRSPTIDWDVTEELCDSFFTTDAAAPFTEPSHRELLLDLIETATGDPLRWSTMRVELAIGHPPYNDRDIPLEVALDAPDLLRAFIPFAHAQSGIRDELTSRALAAIDTLRLSYKREVLRQSQRWDVDDAV